LDVECRLAVSNQDAYRHLVKLPAGDETQPRRTGARGSS
jgi:hypothetical protein